MHLTEPRVLRVQRESKTMNGLLPECPRCGTILERLQLRWCSPACRVAGWRAADDLRRYWLKVAAATVVASSAVRAGGTGAR